MSEADGKIFGPTAAGPPEENARKQQPWTWDRFTLKRPRSRSRGRVAPGSDPEKFDRLARALILAAGLSLAAADVARTWAADDQSRYAPRTPVAVALSGILHNPATVGGDGDIARFYRAHAYQPLWVRRSAIRPEAGELVGLLAHSDRDNLDPERYGVPGLMGAIRDAESRQPAALAHADLMLSRAYATYATDLRTAAPAARVAFTDPAFATPSPAAALEAAAAARSLSQHLADMQRINPIYDALRQQLLELRAGGGASILADESLILANLERARALPASLARRYVLVDTAASTLWLYEDGRISDTMQVVVGKLGEPTPTMAGLIRYAVFHPYWNVPPDLARERFAPGVVRQGVGYLQTQHLEALSDWSDSAHVIDPRLIDWVAVADGRQTVHLRQTPGPDNMMGAVKFIWANPFGVYLHDTPNKAAFRSDQRMLSAGCVRVEDAQRLSRWLFGGAVSPPESGPPEQKVDLPAPIPVYITYLTVAPTPTGLVFQRDIYNRDPALLAALGRRGDRRIVVARR